MPAPKVSRAGLAQAASGLKRLARDDAGDANGMAIVAAIRGAFHTAPPVVRGSVPGMPEAGNRATVGEIADAALAARCASRRLFVLPLAAAAEAAGFTSPREIAP